MKLNKIFAMFMLLGALAFVACEPIDPIDPDGPGQKPDSTVVDTTSIVPDTTGWNIPANALTVAQAREICAKLESGATTGTKYYVKGWVKKLASKHEEGVTKFGNAVFYMEDVKGANSQEDFEAYQVYGLNGAKITSLEEVLVGDYVVVYGELTNYEGTYETVGKGAAHIWKSTNPNLGQTSTPPVGDVTGDGTLEKPYTAADVLTLNNTKSGNYWVKAYIVGQVNGASVSNAEFNAPFTPSTNQTTGALNTYNTNLLIAMSADVTDATQCVAVQLPTGALRSGLNLPENPSMDGQEILIYGSLEKYFGVAGIKSPTYAKVGDKEFGNNPNGSGNNGNGDATGQGTIDNPFTAADILNFNNSKTGNYWTKAYIVGQVNGASLDNAEFNAPFTSSTNQETGALTGYNTNILIAMSADETNSANCVPVQLPSGALRSGLNLVQHPEMDGQEILIYGSLEKYFGAAGIKSPSYAKVGDQEFGTNPNGSGNNGNDGNALLSETLLTQASFDKFTAVNVLGEQVWTYDAKYGAKMSGYANSASVPNEDWFITPAIDLSGKSAATITFDHAFGPAYAMPDTEAKKAQYTIWVSNDFNGDVKSATWTELKGMAYGTDGWAYISSGEIAIPAANLKANCRIAWKYVCQTESSTWEIKNVIVK